MDIEFSDIPKQLASKPELGNDLTQFVNHFGMDSYSPPAQVTETVRQIVLLAVDAAQNYEPSETEQGLIPIPDGYAEQ